MKYLILILFLVSSLNVLCAQQEIVFSDFSINMTNVDKTKHTQFKSRNIQSNSAEVFFYKYFFPETLASYEKLYLPGEFYGLTVENFDTWQQTITNAKVNVEYLIYFNRDGVEYVALPYFIDYDHYVHRHVKLAKLANGQWYPLSRDEDIQMAEIKNMFVVVNSTFLHQLVTDDRNDDSIDLQGMDLTNSVSFQDLVNLREEKYLNFRNSNARNQSLFQSTFEWTGKGLRKFESLVKPEVTQWLTQKNFTSEQINQVIHLLSRGEQIGAVILIDEIENDEQLTASDYIKVLKDIFSKF